MPRWQHISKSVVVTEGMEKVHSGWGGYFWLGTLLPKSYQLSRFKSTPLHFDLHIKGFPTKSNELEDFDLEVLKVHEVPNNR